MSSRERNDQILDGMSAASERIAPAVTRFAEALQELGIRVGLHNYEGFEGEPVLLVVARGDRATEIERLIDEYMGEDWQADSGVIA